MKNKIPQSISLVMRCYNEIESIAETFEQLARQDYAGSIELIVIDSGSTDGSLEIIRQNKPDILKEIKPENYVPGQVMNWAMENSHCDWVVFLNADATPHAENWLSELLVSASAVENFGTAFCPQLARDNAKAVFALDYINCFGEERQSKNWDHFFSMVASLVYKPVWLKYPFKPNLQFAEDDEWSRRLKAAGYEIVFAENAPVIHSHNYSWQESFRRAKGDMYASTIAGTHAKGSLGIVVDVIISALICFLRDIPFHIRSGKIHEIPFAFATRWAQKMGRWSGNHAD